MKVDKVSHQRGSGHFSIASFRLVSQCLWITLVSGRCFAKKIVSLLQVDVSKLGTPKINRRC